MKIVAITLMSISLIVLFSVDRSSAQTLQSDEFDGSGQALQSFWQVNNGEKSDWELNNGQLTIDGGFNQNLWLNDTSTRFYQVTDETQFEIESSFIVEYADACTVTGIVIYSPIGEWVTLKLWGVNNEEARVQFQSRGQDLTPNAYLQPREGRIPIQMRLRRDGDQYEAWYKRDGQGDWLPAGAARVALQGPVEVGIYTGICQREGSGRLTATFDYFRATAITDQTELPTEDSTADYNLPKVRLIYFLPSDRQPQPGIDAKMDTLIKDTQQSYAEVMENHGFGGKTFRIETNETGKAMVHHVNGKFNDAYYRNPSWVVWEEIEEQFDMSNTIYLAVLDISTELIDGRWCGRGGARGSDAGTALIAASGGCFNVGVAAHELGHAFGLQHDFRANRKLISSSYIGDGMITSFCAAEWLDVHRYFNTNPVGSNKPTTTKMFAPRLAYPPNAINLRFEVADPDGLHQARLHLITPRTGGFLGLFDCKRLNGTSSSVEFVTTGLTPESKPSVSLSVIDVHGNISWSERFPIDITSLLPPPEVVSIPDANLATAIRRALYLAISDAFTQLNLLKLTKLDANNRQITDLTGLEHATQLLLLNLGGNQITDISALAELANLTALHLSSNQIINISVLAELTNLTGLSLGGNQITDISALGGLVLLSLLNLGGNQITDISVLAELTNLVWLGLSNNQITDISVLAGLTNLTYLSLWGNSVSDLSPLVENTGLGSGDEVDVRGNPLSYQSIHTHIPDLLSRRIKVEFDDRAHPALLKISGDSQTGASFASLSQPFVIEAQDENGSPLAGVSVTFAVTGGGGALSTTTTTTGPNGRAQSTLILGPNLGRNTVQVSAAGIASTATFYAIADSELPPTIADVNSDGSVNVLDLIFIASNLGRSGQNSADVNGDRVVTVLDLVLAAGMFEEAAAAPSVQPSVPETLTAVEVQGWLTGARSLEAKDPIMKRGFVVLEQLLVSLTPKETELLANYPNPFNPETWIPYRLAEDAFVTLTIYDGSGHAVRTLDVGHRIAAVYENRSKAIYWDGKNNHGEG